MPHIHLYNFFISIGIEVTYQEIYNNLHVVLPIYNKFWYTMKQTDRAFSYSKIGKWESLSSVLHLLKDQIRKDILRSYLFPKIFTIVGLKLSPQIYIPNDTGTTTKNITGKIAFNDGGISTSETVEARL